MPPPSSELRRLDADIRAIVRRLAARGAGSDAVEQEVAALIDARGNDLSGAFRRELLTEAQKRHEWLRGRTLDPAARNAMVGVLGGAASEVARISGSIRSGVIKAVVRGIQRGVPVKSMEAEVARVVRGSQGRAETLVSTALGAFDRADAFRNAEAAGIDRFKLVGPPPQRDWCQNHYGKVYALEEIRRMSNGSKLAVEHYCGGYNCRHTWEPVAEGGSAKQRTRWADEGYKVEQVEKGVVAVDPGWQEEYDNTSRNRRLVMESERTTARLLASTGRVVELPKQSASYLADARVNEREAEMKAPSTFHADALRMQLRSASGKGQSRLVVIRLDQTVQDAELAVQRAQRWLADHPGYIVLVIHAYVTPPRIEELRS